MFSQLVSRTVSATARQVTRRTIPTLNSFNQNRLPQQTISSSSYRPFSTTTTSLPTRRHFSTTAPKAAAEPVQPAAPAAPSGTNNVAKGAENATAAEGITIETTAAATAGAEGTSSTAAYANVKPAIDPAVVEMHKAKIRKKMWYYRGFVAVTMVSYVFFAKKFYNEQIGLYESLPALNAYMVANKLEDIYSDAQRDKWPTPSQAVYTGKDDLNDKKSLQKLLLKNIMIGQQLNSLLLQAKAELFKLSSTTSDAKYKQRFGNDNIYLDLLSSVSDVQNKVCMNGVTTLMAFNHNLDDDEGILAQLNPVVRAKSKTIDAALKDAYVYPTLGKLALRRVNAGLLYINSVLNDEWWAENHEKVKNIDEFERLFSYWESEQGFKRHQFERISNGGVNITPTIATNFIKDEIDGFIAQAKNGRAVSFNSLTLSPLEERVLTLPDPSQVIDMSKFPEKNIWIKTDLVKADVNGVDVPRSGWYYTPLPTLPTKNKVE